MSELLNQKQAAEILGVCRKTMEQIRQKNPDIAVKIAGVARWRFIAVRIRGLALLPVDREPKGR